MIDNHATGADGVKIAVLRKGRANLVILHQKIESYVKEKENTCQRSNMD